MTNEEANTALYKKMFAEQETFKAFLLEQSPEEILKHTYEYTVREDILLSLECNDLSTKQAEALLSSPTPLADVFNDFEHLETDHMETIRCCTEDRAKNILKQQGKDTLSVLLIEPGKKPTAKEIPTGLVALQAAVGGFIEAVYPYDDEVAIICNEEGKLTGLPLNRALRDEEGEIYDVIAGNFLVVGVGDEDFCSLSPELQAKYAQLFENPEMILMLNGKILAIPDTAVELTPLYRQSSEYAAQHDELDAFRASLKANLSCKDAIENAIAENYHDNKLGIQGARDVFEKYGAERTKYVLAVTVVDKDWDERITQNNKAWAKEQGVPERGKFDLRLIIDKCNPGLTNLFIDQIRRIEAERSERKPSVVSKIKGAENETPQQPKRLKPQEIS